jgi:hypothetical protein
MSAQPKKPVEPEYKDVKAGATKYSELEDRENRIQVLVHKIPTRVGRI